MLSVLLKVFVGVVVVVVLPFAWSFISNYPYNAPQVAGGIGGKQEAAWDHRGVWSRCTPSWS